MCKKAPIIRCPLCGGKGSVRNSFAGIETFTDLRSTAECNAMALAQFGPDINLDIDADSWYGRTPMAIMVRLIEDCATRPPLPDYIKELRNCDDMVRIIRGRLCARYGHITNAHFYGAFQPPPPREPHACLAFLVSDDERFHWFDHNLLPDMKAAIDPEGYINYKVRD